MLEIPSLLVDTDDKNFPGENVFSRAFPGRGMGCLELDRTRAENLKYLANERISTDVIYVVTQQENVADIVTISEELKKKEAVKRVAILWMGNEIGKPDAGHVPVISSEKFDKTTFIGNWQKFVGLAEEEPVDVLEDKNILKRLRQTFFWGKTTF